MNFSQHCQCGELLVKALDSATKVRGIKVLVFKEDQALAVCKSCGTETPVPVKLDTELLKSFSSKAPRLYLRELKKST